MKNQKTKWLVYTAVVAALYAALTISMAPISYGAIQLRIPEVLTLLAFVNPQFAPGLIIGCFIANLFSPFGMIDALIGTLATAIAVYSMRYAKNMWMASLTPTIANGIIVGIEVAVLCSLPILETMMYVALGEFIVVTVVGVPVFKVISKKIQKYVEGTPA
ncbi:MAG: QueT transporter family protein [Proteocatella sp.]